MHMKFSEYTYERPDLEKATTDFNNCLEKFNSANSAGDQLNCIKEINLLRSHFDTMYQLASIRHSIDTKEAFYNAEQDFFDANGPQFEALTSKYYTALVNSKFKSEIENELGKQLFRIAEMQLKSFKPEIIEDLVKENQLSTAYTELIAGASILFEGEERTLAEMVPFLRSTDRTIRKAAAEARWKFLADHADELDRLFDELVKTRNTIAIKLGYRNFVEVGYLRMLRSDYNAEMVAQFRNEVLKQVVPLANQLRAKQAHRLGLDALKYYDEALMFSSGNAKPKGDPEWIIGNGKKMYDDLSSETSEFFNFMLSRELMDLVAKKNKAIGGYCTYISGFKSPFIFSNFNGTSADIDVLTHEVGHAFQVFMSRDQETSEYYWPTSDAAEIHSMSMEYFAYPYMDLFFNGEAEKYRYSHLVDSILFLPYGVSVDEFQHGIYENPEMSPAERNQLWRSIEKKYLPQKNYEDNAYLNNGGWWQTQGHIYQSPFYYIDYTLAQMCAFQFWFKAQKQRPEALNDYIRLCKAGGSKSFLELVEYANLKSPFDQGNFTEIINELEEYLQQVDEVGF